MRSEDKSWNITTTTINDDYWNKVSSSGDLPVTVTRNSLRRFIIEILKEKGLLKEQTND